ncbi:MAG: fused MFS/spermidine synthase [Actinomycetota bacterium]|jgi:spermidine synthase|nr:fused MFS/spermidine synthase [Actinomycetota bacterium]
MAPEDGRTDAPPPTKRGWRTSGFFLRVFVFATGAAVMAVEFAAERLLQPFFGNSELVWATLIGLVLLALSLGYAAGGRLADRRPTPSGLGLLALGAGIFVALLPVLASPLLSQVLHGLLATPAGVVIATLAGTSILFMPPVACLGAATPYALRLAVSQPESVGSKAGSLYAWSTAGSIAGTFVPTFYTIPYLGVRTTLWLSAAVLIALGATMLASRFTVLALAVPITAAYAAPPLLKPVPGLIKEVETPYQFAQVYRLSNGDTALSVNDAAGIQSLYTTSRLTGLYYDAYLLLPYFYPATQPLSTLLIGMAAGTIPTLYSRDVDPYRAHVAMTGIELDPDLVALGRQYFHLRPSAAKVIISDGRLYLRRTSHRYNIIIVDAYSQEIYIPFSLATKQFFELCRQHLAAGGTLAINLNATSSTAPLTQAMVRTLHAVFSHVYLAKAPGTYNYFLVASEAPARLPAPSSVPAFLRPVLARIATTWHQPKSTPGIVFTDNRAPVEAMTNQMIINHLLSSP